jgi:hypothetical protein
MKNHAPRWRTEGGAEIQHGADRLKVSNRFFAPSASSRRRPTSDEPIIVADSLACARGLSDVLAALGAVVPAASLSGASAFRKPASSLFPPPWYPALVEGEEAQQ